MIVADDDDGTQIRSWAERGILGIRLRADSRADTADPLAHWRVADELGLVVSAPCSPESLLGTAFQEVLSTFPDLQIVLEHLAGASQQMPPPYTVFQSVLKLAERPTLSIKLPGFGEFCPLPYPFTQVAPLAKMALEAFGPKRILSTGQQQRGIPALTGVSASVLLQFSSRRTGLDLWSNGGICLANNLSTRLVK